MRDLVVFSVLALMLAWCGAAERRWQRAHPQGARHRREA